jgi:hypothetical protein
MRLIDDSVIGPEKHTMSPHGAIACGDDAVSLLRIRYGEPDHIACIQ